MLCSQRSGKVRLHEIAMRQSRPCNCDPVTHVFPMFRLSFHLLQFYPFSLRRLGASLLQRDSSKPKRPLLYQAPLATPQ